MYQRYYQCQYFCIGLVSPKDLSRVSRIDIADTSFIAITDSGDTVPRRRLFVVAGLDPQVGQMASPQPEGDLRDYTFTSLISPQPFTHLTHLFTSVAPKTGEAPPSFPSGTTF